MNDSADTILCLVIVCCAYTALYFISRNKAYVMAQRRGKGREASSPPEEVAGEARGASHHSGSGVDGACLEHSPPGDFKGGIATPHPPFAPLLSDRGASLPTPEGVSRSSLSVDLQCRWFRQHRCEQP